MKSQETHIHGNADYFGIAGSVLCIIHCIVTPLLAVSSSLWMKDDLIAGLHLMNYLFIAVNGIAVYFATRHAHAPWLNRLLWAAFSIFSVSLLLEESNELFHYTSYVGSALLIIAHGLNLYFCRFARN